MENGIPKQPGDIVNPVGDAKDLAKQFEGLGGQIQDKLKELMEASTPIAESSLVNNNGNNVTVKMTKIGTVYINFAKLSDAEKFYNNLVNEGIK